jgi:hypothetical protein
MVINLNLFYFISPDSLNLLLDRLLFPLCKACACAFPLGGRKDDYSCTHSDENRQFIWTGPHIELDAALESGYKVLKVYRVLEYTEW